MNESEKTTGGADIAGRLDGLVSLRPCPFCGGSARLVSDGGSGIGSCVACNKCHASTDDLADDAAAVKLWNTRYVPGYHDVDEFYKDES